MRTAVSASFRSMCAQMSAVKASHYHDVTFLSQLKHKELHILALLCGRGRVQQTQRLQSRQQQNQASLILWINGRLTESKFQPVSRSKMTRRCLQRTRSNHDRTLERLIALKWPGRLSACQIASALPQVEDLVLPRWVDRPCMVPKACQTQACHIAWSLSKC